MLFFLGSSYLLFSQQTICIGSKNNYWVDISENSGNGTTGSNYNWAVLEAGFKGSISKISTSGNRISVDWGATPVGNYTLRVTEDNSLCSNYQDLTVSPPYAAFVGCPRLPGPRSARASALPVHLASALPLPAGIKSRRPPRALFPARRMPAPRAPSPRPACPSASARPTRRLLAA